MPVESAAEAPRAKVTQPPRTPEEAPAPSPRLAKEVKTEELPQKIAAYFEGHAGQRLHIQTDKPLYKPGESIWVRVWDLQTRNLEVTPRPHRLELVSPKGAVVLTKHVQTNTGVANNDFELPSDVQGGEYQLRVTAYSGETASRPIIVSTYEAPRVKKTLEFIRKAYGEGDEVTATIEVKRPTGEPLANHLLTAAIRLDGQDLPRVTLKTNESGGGLVRFTLPKQIAVGDGLLTVLVEDGGVTESVSKSIPIIVKRMSLAFFPEGGRLTQGLASRLYFEAKTPIGKPADVEGRIVDDLGNAVATFQSVKDGLGRVDFTPGTGRTYHAQITRPVGVEEKYTLPLAEKTGCVLRSYDDPDSVLPAIRVQVQCTEKKQVIVAAVLRENTLDVAAVEAAPGKPAVVALKAPDPALAKAQGIARVTVFDEKYAPLAERLVYRNRRNRLQVKVTPDKKSYAPRDAVTLEVKTTDSADKPLAAELALSVVDDTVVSFADDKTGHMLSRLFLEPEIPGKVEEPNFYFDLTEEKSAVAMDLLMGTRGYRTFEWQPVLDPPPPPRPVVLYALKAADNAGLGGLGARGAGPGGGGIGLGIGGLGGRAEARMERRKEPDAVRNQGLLAAKREVVADKREARAAFKAFIPPIPAPPGPAIIDGARVLAREEAKQDLMVLGGQDRDWAGAKVADVAYVPARVFPVPTYSPDDAVRRTDFRETIYWAPSIKTDANGTAKVTFPTSDAVTSFRVFTEGVGDGLVGRDETVFKSSLPFSLSVKLPLEVSAGDKPLVPVTLTNDRDRALDVTLDASFGELVEQTESGDRGGALAAGARKSLFFPLEVTGTQGDSEVLVSASTGGLSDEFTRTMKVTPLGFPQLFAKSGEAKERVTHPVDLGESLPNTVTATVKLYPSPVATLVSGMEGMLREPYGCFEQTSSTNYPNVMVMQYLKEHNVAEPALLTRSAGLLHSGYQKLVGFEAKLKGYEWFGSDPGHEALTAYGLLEFKDMKAVYPDVDDSMVVRTSAWLKGRRDGKGGYQKSSAALDSFGRASPVVTDAYITYSLVAAGERDLDKEIAAQASLAKETKDPYLLALATNTLLLTPSRRAEGQAAAARLATMQGTKGGWTGADHSITRSGGISLETETTALAILALLEARGHDGAVRNGVSWLQENRGGFGQWGATQATVLALKAMTRYANASRATRKPGSVTILVNGRKAGHLSYAAGHRDALVFDELGRYFHPGANNIELVTTGDPLPYSIAVEYRSLKPATSPETKIDLATSLERNELKMGENVRLNAVITNKTDQGQPMTMARIGLPGGLTYQTWQLKELREKGLIGFYETRAREVILYLRDMKPNEVKRIPIDLVATVPGQYTGPASSAYLYYTDEHKTWVDALAVKIAP
jgi:hypothetical protein